MGQTFRKDNSILEAETSVKTCLQRFQFQECENLGKYQLLWLDQHINELQDYVVIQEQLRHIINEVKIFDNAEDCEEHIRSLATVDQKIVLIVSNRFQRNIVPPINDLKQVIAIYIYCEDEICHKQLLFGCKKVKSIFNDSGEMIKQIRIDQRVRERVNDVSLGMSIYSRLIDGRDEDGRERLRERNAMFIHLQLFTDVILHTKVQQKNSKKNFLEFLKEKYKDNAVQLAIINEFERDYQPEKAIWWYTRNCCLYYVLNEALRNYNFDVLIAFRYFICDLYKQLSTEHHRQSFSTERVFRGQGISDEELSQLQNSVGELIRMNSFLSTTTSREIGEFYAESSADGTGEIKPILFIFDINTRTRKSSPFASIEHLSYFKDEEEILIALGTIFRIIDVKYNEKQNIWHATLEMCSEDDSDLKAILTFEKSQIQKVRDWLT